MRTYGQNDTIVKIINYLYENPKKLYSQFSTPEIKLIFSNCAKRFTEFHKIKVSEVAYGDYKELVFWIRIVKNKDSEAITKILSKQYQVNEIVYNYLQEKNNTINLTCCQPITLLTKYNAVITKNCSGRIFNDYLRFHIPFVHEKQILKHCFNSGIWLKFFHDCFRQNGIPEIMLDKENKDRINKLLVEKTKHGYGHASLTLCHNDFSPRNFFVGQNLIETIDFVGVTPGFPQQDIDFFINYVSKARFNFLYSQKLKQRMISKFLQGYNSSNA